MCVCVCGGGLSLLSLSFSTSLFNQQTLPPAFTSRTQKTTTTTITSASSPNRKRAALSRVSSTGDEPNRFRPHLPFYKFLESVSHSSSARGARGEGERAAACGCLGGARGACLSTRPRAPLLLPSVPPPSLLAVEREHPSANFPIHPWQHSILSITKKSRRASCFSLFFSSTGNYPSTTPCRFTPPPLVPHALTTK